MIRWFSMDFIYYFYAHCFFLYINSYTNDGDWYLNQTSYKFKCMMERKMHFCTYFYLSSRIHILFEWMIDYKQYYHFTVFTVWVTWYIELLFFVILLSLTHILHVCYERSLEVIQLNTFQLRRIKIKLKMKVNLLFFWSHSVGGVSRWLLFI